MGHQDRHRQASFGVGVEQRLARERFPVDPTAWDNFDSSDISLAIEAQKRGLPRIAIARHAGWLRDIGKPQSDSLWARKQKDDSQPTRQMLTLLGLYS